MMFMMFTFSNDISLRGFYVEGNENKLVHSVHVNLHVCLMVLITETTVDTRTEAYSKMMEVSRNILSVDP